MSNNRAKMKEKYIIKKSTIERFASVSDQKWKELKDKSDEVVKIGDEISFNGMKKGDSKTICAYDNNHIILNRYVIVNIKNQHDLEETKKIWN